MIKGLRAISDFEYEFEMAQLNRKLDASIESVYIIASPHYSFLSSTGVKEMATFGGNVSELVPGPVAKALAERLDAASDAGLSGGGGSLPAAVGKILQKAEEITFYAQMTLLPLGLRWQWTSSS